MLSWCRTSLVSFLAAVQKIRRVCCFEEMKRSEKSAARVKCRERWEERVILEDEYWGKATLALLSLSDCWPHRSRRGIFAGMEKKKKFPIWFLKFRIYILIGIYVRIWISKSILKNYLTFFLYFLFLSFGRILLRNNVESLFMNNRMEKYVWKIKNGCLIKPDCNFEWIKFKATWASFEAKEKKN